MSLEQESYYHQVMGTKGRSASISAPGFPNMELMQSGRRNHGIPSSNNHAPTTRENGQSSRYRDDYPPPRQVTSTTNNASSGTATPPTNKPSQRKQGAHRSQSARVVGSKPKIKRRERDLRDYQQHLDLASSEGALPLRDCQESYNPFLRKVPSSGRLITSSSQEMSNNSLYGTPPPPLLPNNHQITPPRDSPKFSRRQSTQQGQSGGGGGFERRGSDKSTPEKDKKQGLGVIPVIATPESSPMMGRRASTKPAGLPRSPQVSRSGSQRRANSVKGRRNTGYLDVPDSNNSPPDDEDEESYRLRSFSVTPKGIVNRGDSFRRRRSRSNSLIPTPATTPELQRNGTFTSSEDGLLLPQSESFDRRSPMPSPKSPVRPFPKSTNANAAVVPDSAMDQGDHEPLVNHRVAMIGTRGVGKAALVSQFMTSEGINAYDRQNDVEGEETVSVMLNGEESELTFFKINNTKTELNRLEPPEAFVLVYSVVDRTSFQRAEAELRRLQEWDLTRTKAVVLVANKIDLARSRAVSTQDGRCLAVAFRVKFIEVSVGINHNVDELLVGILHQIRLKQAQAGNQDSWCKHRGILRASVKARQMLTWLLGKEDAKFKNCENLHIL